LHVLNLGEASFYLGYGVEAVATSYWWVLMRGVWGMVRWYLAQLLEVGDLHELDMLVLLMLF
jgi:hypothetical protein